VNIAPFLIAMHELGIEELPGTQHNRRILEYHSTTRLDATEDEIPWCSSFVNWCVKRSGLDGTNSARARSWVEWGEQIFKPALGDVVVFARGNNPAQGHVGFYAGGTYDYVWVLGGNQSNTVKYSQYDRKKLICFRRGIYK